MENITNLGPYKIIKEINHGDLSKVYQVKHPQKENVQVLKLFSDQLTAKNDFVLTFHNDCPKLINLSHPNIVTIQDYGQEDTHFYTVMDYIQGSTIKQLLQKAGPFSLDLALNVLHNVSSALAYAFDKGFNHLNLKSSNIFIASSGKALLSDFALSKGITLSTILDKSIPIENAVNTLAYFAPEQLYANMGKVGPASDIYSLGILLYQMLCGQPPFIEKVPILLAHMHISVTPEPLFYHQKALPQWLQGVLDKMLAKDPLHRYQNVSELLSALKAPITETVSSEQACEASLKGKIINNRYRIDKLIGKPHQSMLYLGFDLHTEQSISIEVPTGSSNFIKMQHQRETETLLQIEHPGFVKFIDLVDLDEFQYIIREYAKGQKLSQILKSEPMSVENALLVMTSILDSINYLHQRGLLHREISSEMVTITPDLQVKITSYILNKASDGSSVSSGSLKESLEYTAPEKITNSIYDYRSEVYSLGILFYEVLCGKPPFSSDLPIDIINMHLTKKAVFPPKIKENLPVELQNIIFKAIEKDPTNRYQSVQEMHDTVTDLLLSFTSHP